MNKLIRFAVDHPVWTILATLVLAIGFAFPIQYLKQETDFKEFLDDDDPIIVLMDEAEEKYGKSWGIMVMLFN